MYARHLYFFILIIIFNIHSNKSDSNSLQCKDENGDPVDWYVLYKLPKVAESSEPLIRKGLAYLYITNKTIDLGWQLSKKEIGSKDSVPGKTLSLLYKDNIASKKGWIMYSDQAPNENSAKRYGHAKGIVMTDEHQGFWLIHSVPNYPPSPLSGEQKRKKHSLENFKNVTNDIPDGEYLYPNSGKSNGQSFLCISMNADQMDIVGRLLIYNQVIPYRYNMPEDLTTQYPALLNASKAIRIKTPPYYHKKEIHSSQGLEFISFAKSDKWQKDLYDDFVAPQLQSDLLAETWLNGRGKLPSECNGSKVYNVQSILLNNINIDFKSTRDHSKWAVAMSNKQQRNWVCIGDINRADTQFNRGGGTVCVNLLKLWNNYRSSVNDIEPCPKKQNFFQKSMTSIKSWFGNIVKKISMTE
ncbi:plancitoxin-1 [Chelonus insularis]|uniref:plancitoxin-1 n=1 Tax=Chelonus insularis TaxID=460826 RepID=UPI00158C63A8|nr:plancitoxin-1 [Chelonus insularis]